MPNRKTVRAAAWMVADILMDMVPVLAVAAVLGVGVLLAMGLGYAR